MVKLHDHIADPDNCEHDWIPVSFRFETQLLNEHGNVRIRQPDTEAGRVYFVCVGCSRHTYMDTEWVGYQLYGSTTREAWIEEQVIDQGS